MNTDTIAVIVGEMREAVQSGEPMKFRYLTEWADRLAALGWRPIETAPEDGSTILIWSDQAHMVVWSGDGFYDAYEEYTKPESPTHWMPLPAAPTGDRDD